MRTRAENRGATRCVSEISGARDIAKSTCHKRDGRKRDEWRKEEGRKEGGQEREALACSGTDDGTRKRGPETAEVTP